MDFIAPYFQVRFQSAANPAAVVQVEQARFTVLADRMIRMEYSPSGVFEDRASQAFWYREQPVPAFTVGETRGWARIETPALVLHYLPGKPFADTTLMVDLKETGVTWRYGDPDPGNLGGTARTLDEVNGAIPLSLGLVSRSGWSVIDDSASLVFNDRSWLEPRGAPVGQQDLYFLGYGHDYLACLRDFNRVSGPVPMIPRWVLGNWWSRYWAYTQEELTQLVKDFQEKQVPLSVLIVDMDWHITHTGNDSSGWTGYSWNRELFPDPAALLDFVKASGLKAALNLHPAEGIHRHETMYAEMCAALGQDPADGEPVAFDITEPRFVDAYFRILHHPMEAAGIDFWWMDWQQGQKSKVSGLDPLWWLNHLHFYDLGRDGTRRSFIFSRWGGLGNHRYPIGFSGDTVVSWASLAFQPYFTATASNVNYGWWSHDIGGHMGGVEDPELFARWVQLGVFLPVLRLHATKNPYQDRRPWLYDAETFDVLRDALQLRHAMIPYLYSMAWRYHNANVPPLLPMYYAYPEQEAAYHSPDQYLFGDQLLVAPFITQSIPLHASAVRSSGCRKAIGSITLPVSTSVAMPATRSMARCTKPLCLPEPGRLFPRLQRAPGAAPARLNNCSSTSSRAPTGALTYMMMRAIPITI
jgi:alpha-glucosidase (family GH31 glycosyl hydrolase)